MTFFWRLVDLLYPPRCPVCHSFVFRETLGRYACVPICPSCRADFHPLSGAHCSVCARPFWSGSGESHVCETCLRKRPFFHRLGSPYLYDGSLQTIIHLFKYGRRSGLAAFLGPLLSSFAHTWIPDEQNFLVMPVPLHPKRLRERGFNQSKLLAGYVARELCTELDFLSLRRIKYTLPQARLGKDDRRKNVRGAFDLKMPERASGKTVLLVDDVATTGNTLNECARVLLKAGADEVLGLVVARTPNTAF